jgi:DNA-binding MarR family transcriptional regulator
VSVVTSSIAQAGDGRDRSSFDRDELATWSGLATVLEWLPAVLDAQLVRDAEVTHFEFGVMYALLRATDHTLRMSVLAGYANSSLTRLSRAVTRLERRQWVRRETDPEDGRYTLAVLTDLGRAKVEQATPGHVATVRRLVLEPLTMTQQRQLRDITRRILAAAGPGQPWLPPNEEQRTGPA